MSTAVRPRLVPNKTSVCPPTLKTKRVMRHKPYPSCQKATHSSLKVCKGTNDPQTSSKSTLVNVFDGYKSITAPLYLKSTDTIGKLQEDYLKIRPELAENLNLTYNGKPVEKEKTLGEMGVKAGAMFIIFQKCPGG